MPRTPHSREAGDGAPPRALDLPADRPASGGRREHGRSPGRARRSASPGRARARGRPTGTSTRHRVTSRTWIIKKLRALLAPRPSRDQGSPARFRRRRLGVRPHRHRRCLARGFRHPRAGRARPQCVSCLLQALRYYRARRAPHPLQDRQRGLLQVPCLPAPAAPPGALANPALHAPCQRQGRALQPGCLREWACATATSTSESAPPTG